jgi:Ser/Thr protein kinase RdoA (MazF antagonist)
LNQSVFRDLEALASNLERVTNHLLRVAAARGTPAIVAPPIATLAGGWLHVDESGAAWRATAYVEGTRVLGSDASNDELRAAAHAFATFSRDLADVGALADTIPRFHDLPRRRTDLAAAVAADRVGRVAECRAAIARTHRLCDRFEAELPASEVEHLPRRVVHNDAKLDNVLVDAETGAVACLVDLDTVMYGTILNDFGELTRTAVSPAPEDETELSKIVLDVTRFTALADGYLAGIGTGLADSERQCLAPAGPCLTLENAVRFLTDHLDGDRYFRIHHAGHNEQRAAAQLQLAELMLEQLDTLREAVMNASAHAS